MQKPKHIKDLLLNDLSDFKKLTIVVNKCDALIVRQAILKLLQKSKTRTARYEIYLSNFDFQLLND